MASFIVQPASRGLTNVAAKASSEGAVMQLAVRSRGLAIGRIFDRLAISLPMVAWG